MTDAERQASIRRHERFLTPEQREVLMPSEAELQAGDRMRALAKDNGTLERLEAHWAIRDQVRADSMAGSAS